MRTKNWKLTSSGVNYQYLKLTRSFQNKKNLKTLTSQTGSRSKRSEESHSRFTEKKETKRNPEMATALASRAAIDRTPSLLKLSFNFLRSFSTASPSPSAQNPNDSSSSASKKPKRKKKKNLFELAQFLPNWGIGYHMAKTHWTGVSYQITKINLYKVLSLWFFNFVKRERNGKINDLWFAKMQT